MLAIPKSKPIRDRKHRMFIASLPCLVSGATNVQCAHIRKGNICGVGMKPSDEFCVPLSCEEHAVQHDLGELHYWQGRKGYEAASALGKKLYAVTGDREKALELIEGFRK